MKKSRIVDMRGYTGPERNRKMSPEEVTWAREMYYAGKISTIELAQMHDMAVDSVRRMLRGETYGNVREALPREHAVEAYRRVEKATPELQELFQASVSGEREKQKAAEEEKARAEKKAREDAAFALLRAPTSAEGGSLGVDAQGETPESRAARQVGRSVFDDDEPLGGHPPADRV